jgi:hypothetical protein
MGHLLRRNHAMRTVSRFILTITGRFGCPLWVIRYRRIPAGADQMSAMPPIATELLRHGE